ncbi:MAG: hypothetical protein IJ234_01355 [Clostridia bacterium]|nr:hypothetical protein [Clostridia bacterium]
MEIIVCDVCKRCIIGNDPSKDATMRMKDLFGSRTITIFNPAAPEEGKWEMTLCTTCKETLYYYMTNREALIRDTQSMTLTNRLRFLFKKPLKHE